MTLRYLVAVAVVPLTAAALFISSAASSLLPTRPISRAPALGTASAPTAQTLPSAAYPWVQPVWIKVDGVRLPILASALVGGSVEPPGWILAA